MPSEAIEQLCRPDVALVAELSSIGFKYITLDLEGFRSGSQNRVLDKSALRHDLPLVELPVVE